MLIRLSDLLASKKQSQKNLKLTRNRRKELQLLEGVKYVSVRPCCLRSLHLKLPHTFGAATKKCGGAETGSQHLQHEGSRVCG